MTIILAFTCYICKSIPCKYFLTPYKVFCFEALPFCIWNETKFTINLNPLEMLKDVEQIIIIKKVAYLYQSNEKSEYKWIEAGL
jgi:hypothetical protein